MHPKKKERQTFSHSSPKGGKKKKQGTNTHTPRHQITHEPKQRKRKMQNTKQQGQRERELFSLSLFTWRPFFLLGINRGKKENATGIFYQVGTYGYVYRILTAAAAYFLPSLFFCVPFFHKRIRPSIKGLRNLKLLPELWITPQKQNPRPRGFCATIKMCFLFLFPLFVVGG